MSLFSLERFLLTMCVVNQAFVRELVHNCGMKIAVSLVTRVKTMAL